jgi:glycosyltransferase involved in cell wall biosynthesis
MSEVSERGESADYRVISSAVKFSEHPLVLNQTTQHDGGKSVVLPLKISILMCAFNEQERIEKAISEVLCTTYPCDIELIVVDDGSTDDTELIAEKISDPRLVVHRLANNMGKGYALRCAASLATGTHMLPFDADLEYSPDDIPRLIEPVIKRDYDVVFGARIFGLNTVYQSYRYGAGNRILTRIANILFDTHISDLHTCLKLVSLAVFRQLALNESRFGLDTELTATLLRLGVRPFEVPVSYYSRSHAQGKKIGWRDAISCVVILVRVRLRRRKRLFATDRDPADLITGNEVHLLQPCAANSISSKEADLPMLADAPG